MCFYLIYVTTVFFFAFLSSFRFFIEVNCLLSSSYNVVSLPNKWFFFLPYRVMSRACLINSFSFFIFFSEVNSNSIFVIKYHDYLALFTCTTDNRNAPHTPANQGQLISPLASLLSLLEDIFLCNSIVSRNWRWLFVRR